MKRIRRVFSSKERKALIAYLTVGYPSVEATLEAVPRLVEAGCDMVELGIPFSDPLADGATIQRASHAALEQGVTPESCLEAATQLRKCVDTPLLLMSYYNPVLRYGLERFCARCEEAGVDGLIVPDLPPEEGAALEETTASRGLALVYLLAPTSTLERVRLVASHSRGFIYIVSLKGVTGARDELPPGLGEFVRRVRGVASQPLCVGFGIATPEQAARVASAADGVIIGSRLVEMVASGKGGLHAATSFIRDVRQALDGVSAVD